MWESKSQLGKFLIIFFLKVNISDTTSSVIWPIRWPKTCRSWKGFKKHWHGLFIKHSLNRFYCFARSFYIPWWNYIVIVKHASQIMGWETATVCMSEAAFLGNNRTGFEKDKTRKPVKILFDIWYLWKRLPEVTLMSKWWRAEKKREVKQKK